MSNYYYAVANGRSTGVYDNWNDCKDQVNGYSGSDFKKFESRAEAENFIESRSSSTSYSSTYSSYPSSSGSSSSYRSYGSSSSQSARLQRDEQGYVDVYTDGACSSNGTAGAQAGIGVWFDDQSSYNVSKPASGRPTNNNAEIRAATEAARQAQRAGVDKLRIHTDSEFLVKCKNEWMPKWKQNNWTNSTGEPVKNREELIEMERAFKPLDVELKHVPGHKGVYGNERADQLARDWIRKR